MIKKLLAIGAALLTFTISYSQKFVGRPVKPILDKISSLSYTPTDTLWGTFKKGMGISPTIYSVKGGSGYIVGNNNYGDKAKAQVFNVTTPYKVEGVLLWFGAYKYNSLDVNSVVKVNLYNLNGTGESTKGTGVACPGTVITSEDLMVQNIDTVAGAINIIMFSGPQQVTSSYAAGMDFQALVPGDTVGLVSSLDKDAKGSELSWEQWKDGKWYTMLAPAGWKLDIDFAIFPIVDLSVGFNEMEYMNGIRLSKAYPNPAKYYTTIKYAINMESDVVLEIYDMNGKQVVRMNEGKRLAGEYSLKVDLADFSAGTYFYSLKSNSGRLTMKMIVE